MGAIVDEFVIDISLSLGSGTGASLLQQLATVPGKRAAQESCLYHT